MVRPAGLEPVTPTMSRWCSNQLSYGRSKKCANNSYLFRLKQVFYLIVWMTAKKLTNSL